MIQKTTVHATTPGSQSRGDSPLPWDPGRSGQRKSPLVTLTTASILWVGTALLALTLLVGQAWVGIRFIAPDTGRGLVASEISADGPAHGIVPPGTTMVSIYGSQGVELPLTADMVVTDPDMLPRISAWRDLQRRLGILEQIMDSQQVGFRAADGRTFILSPRRRRPVSDVAYHFWLTMFFGLCSLLIVVGIWDARRNSTSVRLLVLAGLGVSIAAFANGIYCNRELAFDPVLFARLASLNHAGVFSLAVGTIGLLWHYPQRLRPWPALPAIIGLALFFWLNEQFAWTELPIHTYSFPVGAMFTLCIYFGVWQWIKSRHQPVGRAALKWMLFSIFFFIGMTFAIYFLPAISMHRVIIPISWTFSVLLMTFVGLVLGVFRYRLFDIERWWFNAWIWFFAGLLVICIDLLIVAMLPVMGRYATGISLLLAGWLYFPLRQWLWKKTFRHQDKDDIEAVLPQLLSGLLNESIHEPGQWWQDLMQDTFRPAKITRTDLNGNPAILENGGRMYVPFPVGDSGLILTSADRGRRLFSPTDLELAEVMRRLAARVSGDIAAYRRGIAEERRRIMRDLHDDISGQILTLMHRLDNESHRKLARSVFASLRELIYCLDDKGSMDLELLATKWEDMARDRCEAAGVNLRWKTSGCDRDTRITGRAYYNLGMIFKESLANAIRHGNGGEVTISVKKVADSLFLTVYNRYAGTVDKEDPLDRGKGMHSMRDRAIELGGRFRARTGVLCFIARVGVPMN